MLRTKEIKGEGMKRNWTIESFVTWRFASKISRVRYIAICWKSKALSAYFKMQVAYFLCDIISVFYAVAKKGKQTCLS